MSLSESAAAQSVAVDPQRLHALAEYRILDTPPEAAFDDIARLAAEICHTPIAVVNFIAADRQYFKAEVGLGVSSTPLTVSMCANALVGGDLLVIPDTQADPRTADNPLAQQEPPMRFYAGAVLRTAEGFALGTLCVLDHKPRELSDHQARALQSLARQVMTQLELRRTVARLRQSEGEFAAAFDQVLTGMVVADLDGKVVRANEAFCRIVGRPLETLIGRDSRWYTHPEDVRKNLLKIRRIENQDAGSTVFEKRYVRPDEQIVLVKVSLSAVRDAQDRLVAMVGAVEDITARRLAEQRDQFLIRLDDATRSLTDPRELTQVTARLLGQEVSATRCAYCDFEEDQETLNLTGDYHDGVPSMVGQYQLTQFSTECRDRLLAGDAFDVYDVDHDPRTADVRETFRQAQIRSIVVVPLHKDGRLVAAVALHQNAPRKWSFHELELLHRVASRCWESIERARISRAMRDSEERYRILTLTVSAIVWVSDPQGGIKPPSTSWGLFTGQTEGQYAGWGWIDAVHPDDRDRIAETWRQCLQKRTRYEGHYRLRRFDGEYRHVIARGAPLLAADGAVKEWVGNCNDVTDQRQAEEDRERLLDSERAARSEAERASRHKDEFLATLSHELRTPLNAIVGWAQVLRRTGVRSADDFTHGMDAIERNARVQTKLIEDLLDMSRIVSGKLRLNMTPVNLTDVISDALDAVRPSADQKQIRLQSVLNARRTNVLGDPARLQQVVWNLLTNAVKFTAAGGEVQVTLEQFDAHVRIAVSDTGKGIKPEFLPFLFERFRQADASTTRQHGGLGLGLALVKQLTELHGGTASVSSEGDGHGATFSIMLPLPIFSQDSPRNGGCFALDSGVDLAGVSVLVVDDEPDARNLARRLLEECRASVSTAGSAAEAFDVLRSQRPDVVVSDIGMPGEDGYTFIRRVRELPHEEGGGTPAAALTAFARSEDRSRALMAGFQSHITKPVEPMELLAVVASLAGRTNADAATPRE